MKLVCRINKMVQYLQNKRHDTKLYRESAEVSYLKIFPPFQDIYIGVMPLNLNVKKIIVLHHCSNNMRLSMLGA